MSVWSLLTSDSLGVNQHCYVSAMKRATEPLRKDSHNEISNSAVCRG